MTFALLLNLETCAAPECVQPVTVELRHPSLGTTGVWIGWCARHALRHDGLDARTVQ